MKHLNSVPLQLTWAQRNKACTTPKYSIEQGKLVTANPFTHPLPRQGSVLYLIVDIQGAFAHWSSVPVSIEKYTDVTEHTMIRLADGDQSAHRRATTSVLLYNGARM